MIVEDDLLLEEFRKLELEVLQRDCLHPKTKEVDAAPGAVHKLCSVCDKDLGLVR